MLARKKNLYLFFKRVLSFGAFQHKIGFFVVCLFTLTSRKTTDKSVSIQPESQFLLCLLLAIAHCMNQSSAHIIFTKVYYSINGNSSVSMKINAVLSSIMSLTGKDVSWSLVIRCIVFGIFTNGGMCIIFDQTNLTSSNIKFSRKKLQNLQ